jgi:hypothetical protein
MGGNFSHGQSKRVRIDGTNVVFDVLCPEWDILIEIQNALFDLPGLRLKFIKGHQDEKFLMRNYHSWRG